MLIRSENEAFKSIFKVLEEGVVFEGKLNHRSRVVDLLVFVEGVKTSQVFTFLVTNDGLLYL